MKIITIYVLILTLCSCKVYENVEYAHSYRAGLRYINYCTPTIKLPENRYFTQNKKCSKKYLYNNSNENLQICGDKIIGELLDTLMNIDLINLWKEEFDLFTDDSTYIDTFEYKFKKRGEYILEKKKISSLYYWGELNLSDNFKSHLIMKYEDFDNPSGMKLFSYDVYLINSIIIYPHVKTTFPVS